MTSLPAPAARGAGQCAPPSRGPALLVREQLAESRLRAVDVTEVAIAIDERIRRVFGRVAFPEFAIAAELSRMRGQEDVQRQAARHPEAALEVGADAWIVLRLDLDDLLARAAGSSIPFRLTSWRSSRVRAIKSNWKSRSSVRKCS